MNYSELITYVDQGVTNSVEESYKLGWLNELDRNVFRDICTEFKSVIIPLVNGTSEYDITGYKFEDIRKVVVDGNEYLKMSMLDFTDKSFYKSAEKIAIYPVPSESSVELKVIYIYRPIPKTELTQDDELEICKLYGSEFSTLYEYYLRYKILFHQREYLESNQMAEMFNDASKSFAAWYLNNVANGTAITKKAGWIVT